MGIEIRVAVAADAPAIARVRREAWFAAYARLIDPEIIDRVTAAGGDTADPPPCRTSLVAVAPAADGPGAVLGYAAFGPERAVASQHPASALTPAGLAGQTGELYSLYVDPAWWSTGTGRALTGAVLAALRLAGYPHVVLWTLTGNDRARRFYGKLGFAPDGARNILTGLGGVEELRYARDL